MASAPPPNSLRREKEYLGPYKPTLIIHGGAGTITRSNLPPDLYKQYHKSLIKYLTSTKSLLEHGSSALDAACHAVSCMEDDPLFNCGRGSVFTRVGTIEMEASVMVASVNKWGSPDGSIKRAGAVSLVRNTRHPILLAKEVLLDADRDKGLGGTSTMHCHLSGRNVERWGWEERRLERKEDSWFWTRRRWEEHRRGLRGAEPQKAAQDVDQQMDGHCKAGFECKIEDGMTSFEGITLPSQGTVGAVCLDSWGNVAVATSTGGLTNKAPGRIGDTPTVGAGFWAESWEETSRGQLEKDILTRLQGTVKDAFSETILACLPASLLPINTYTALRHIKSPSVKCPEAKSTVLQTRQPVYTAPSKPEYSQQRARRVVAMSGTGNGDSFLRINAARTAAAIARFNSSKISLSQAVAAIAGPGGELERSAGDRWEKTGEGQGGIIGIEVSDDASIDMFGRGMGIVVFDFNCGGLWRAYYKSDPVTGAEVPNVMVFREKYQ